MTNGLGTEDHDQEGRLITAEYLSYYGDFPCRMSACQLSQEKKNFSALQQFVGSIPLQMACRQFHSQLTLLPCAVVNVYVPNSGEGLKRLDYRVGSWDVAFSDYLASLRKMKPVILTGDLNCAHQDIDIHDPKRNLRSAGFTKVAILPWYSASESALILLRQKLLPACSMTVVQVLGGYGAGRTGILQRAAPAEGLQGRIQGDLPRCCRVHLLELQDWGASTEQWLEVGLLSGECSRCWKEVFERREGCREFGAICAQAELALLHAGF